MGRFLGQHFLSDTAIVFHIVDTVSGLCQKLSISCIIEIGPGQGAITQGVAPLVSQFCAVEYDPLMIRHLQKQKRWDSTYSLIHDDALLFDWKVWLREKNIDPAKTLIVGNFPYYITSPLLQKYTDPMLAGCYCMIQDDVAKKIVTDAKKKSYLWRLLSANSTVLYESFVPPASFSPPPKVDSAMILCLPRAVSLIEEAAYKNFFAVLDIVSHAKRKTVGANCKRVGLSIGSLAPALASARIEEYDWEMMGELIQWYADVM